MQFIRLTCAITMLLVGLSIEQYSDRKAKKAIFLVIFALISVKLYLEI